MSALFPIVHRRPPRLYRTARGLRWASLAVLIVLIVFLGTAIYSTVRLVQSIPQPGPLSYEFGENGSIELNGTIRVGNPGLYPIDDFQVTLRVLNSTGELLGQSDELARTLPAGSSSNYSVGVEIPVGPSGAGGSLLVADQYLVVDTWGNATFAYLFPVSIHLAQNVSWGAPFAGYRVTIGVAPPPTGPATVPVTVSFADNAQLPEAGELEVTLESARGVSCGASDYPVDVTSGGAYSVTQDVAVASGCSLAGGSAVSTFVTQGLTISLPPEAFP